MTAVPVATSTADPFGAERRLWRAAALRLWQREVRSGRRSPAEFDWLWRAACLDAEAEESDHDGLPQRADQQRRRAAAVIVAAAARPLGAKAA